MDIDINEMLDQNLWEGKHYAFSAPASSENLTTTVSFEFIDLEKRDYWLPKAKRQKVGVVLKIGFDKPIIRPASSLIFDQYFYELDFEKADIEKLGPDDMIIKTLQKALKSRCFSYDHGIEASNYNGPKGRIACKYVLNHYFNKELHK